MSQRQERIAPPKTRSERSLFSKVVTPLNVTLLGLAGLFLPAIDNRVASILFFILRPLTIPLTVAGVAFIVSIAAIIASGAVGLRPRFLAFGPIQIHSGGPSGWGIGINRTWRHYVGSVLLTPAAGSFSRVQAIVSAGAGLTTSLALLIGLTAYARSLGWPGVDDPATSVQVETLLIAALLGAGIVVLVEFLTAGTVLSAILRGAPEQARRMLANMTIASRMASGERPRAWERQLLDEAISLPDSTADHLMGLCFAYLAAVDHGDYASANQYLRAFERWLQESNPNVRPYVLSSLTGYASLYHERAWLTAAHRKDLDAASEYLNRAADFDVATTIDLRVKAEILALEGDLDAAQSVARAALDALDQFPTMERWRAPFERDLLDRVLHHPE